MTSLLFFFLLFIMKNLKSVSKIWKWIMLIRTTSFLSQTEFFAFFIKKKHEMSRRKLLIFKYLSKKLGFFSCVLFKCWACSIHEPFCDICVVIICNYSTDVVRFHIVRICSTLCGLCKWLYWKHHNSITIFYVLYILWFAYFMLQHNWIWFGFFYTYFAWYG